MDGTYGSGTPLSLQAAAAQCDGPLSLQAICCYGSTFLASSTLQAAGPRSRGLREARCKGPVCFESHASSIVRHTVLRVARKQYTATVHYASSRMQAAHCNGPLCFESHASSTRQRSTFLQVARKQHTATVDFIVQVVCKQYTATVHFTSSHTQATHGNSPLCFESNASSTL